VLVEVEIFAVVEQLGVQFAGEKLVDVPDGSPEAEKVSD
jgi:hypothetical protein